MKLCRVFFSLAVICSLSSVLPAQQRMVLYESFINSYINCPAVDDFSTAVDNTLKQPANQSRLIHLNYHVTNVGDKMAAESNPSASAMFAKIVGSSNIINVCGVDRTTFGSTNLKISSSNAEWNQAITDELKMSPTVTIKLINAQIDKISSSTSSRFIATVEVTGAQTSDTMAIHYAVLQDGVKFPQCPDAKPKGPTNHNDVVRYVTVTDSLLNFKTQTKNTVTYVQNISKTYQDFDLTAMKLVAWVEDHQGGDYSVAQAALLQSDLNDLPAPAASLILNSAILDDAVFAPGDLITIFFDKVSIDSVKVEYSLDDGGSWQPIGNTHDIRMYWNAPGTITSKGKIRISDLSNGKLISTEGRTFSIKQADHSLSILTPRGNDLVYIGQKDTITWNQHAVDTLFVEYSVDDGAHWQTLNFHKDPTHVANSFLWNVTGNPTAQARIRLRPFASELATLTSISDAFQVVNVNTGVHPVSDELFSIAINPQPVRRSEQLSLNLKLDAYSGVDISLFDMSGKKVIARDHAYFGAGNNTIGLQLNSLAAGTYVLEVRLDDGMVRTMKVIVE